MKHAVAILFCLSTVASMATENRVRCIEPYSPSHKEPAPYSDLSRVTTSCFDGLGRLIVSACEGDGGDFENVYALTVYGRGGEVAQMWQPVGLHSGSASASVIKSAAQSFYGCGNPFTAKTYDLSEDMRTSVTVRPGSEAQALTEHDLCYDNEIPVFFANGNGKLERKGHYAEGTLLLKASTDESLIARYTYTDFSGRKVAEMVGDAWTYWAYDVCGRLRFVVSPKGATLLSADGVCDDGIVTALCSEMAYDGYGRVVMSRPQGVAPTFYVYDGQSRLICEQDGHLRQNGQWRFYAYDSKSRLAVAGVFTGEWTQKELARKYAGGEITATFSQTVDKDISLCYRLDNVPTDNRIITAAYYYDTYDFWTADWALPVSADYPFTSASSRMGKATGYAVMGSCGYPVFSVTVCDERDRVRAACRRQYTGEFVESTFTDYNYIGQPVRQTTLMSFPLGEWQSNPDEVRIDRRYTYMRDGGKIYMDEIQVDGGGWQHSIYDYDSAGRLVGKRGGSGGDETYVLDVQGRILTVDGKNIKESLSYIANGMVAEKTTKVPYEDDTVGSGMEYRYDEQGFMSGEYDIYPNDSKYDRFEYDLNGNIVRHHHAGSMVLTDYSGNRVSCVVDTLSMPDEYGGTEAFQSRVCSPVAYDTCGRIVADKRSNVKEIRYNNLHQPQTIMMDNGNVLRFRYDADGVKECETRTVRLANGRLRTTRREYYGAVQRVDGITERVEWDDGFFLNGDDGRWHSHRYVRNTNGSIVAVADSVGQIVQAVDYYASGLPIVHSKSKEPVTRRMHTGKEFVEFEGLSLYDNGARFYSPVDMRFITPDPLTLDYPDLSPYVYCGNNPVNAIDPLGMDTVNISYLNGKWLFEKPRISDGSDVFNIMLDGVTKSYVFSEGKYGERVDMLNLHIGEMVSDYALGIYHISGSDEDGTGYYVAPGGEPSVERGSGRRIPDGEYPIVAPSSGVKWRQPGVGGCVAGRGIRFHIGSGNARLWTEGCFVLSSDYLVDSKHRILYRREESTKAVHNFDLLLGADRLFDYTYNGKTRPGASFSEPIKYILTLKSINR